MNDFSKKLHFKYQPKFSTIILYFILLFFALFLFWGRKEEAIRLQFILDEFPGFYQHISNFTLTYLLYSGICFLWLLMGVNFIKIILMGLALVVCNFIYELFIPILNTPDIFDFYFGVVGAVLGLGFLKIVKKYGMFLVES